VQFEQAKMMLVVRKDLGMSIGKIAAQVGHAVLFGYKEALRVDPSAVQAWEIQSSPKIAVAANSEEEIDEL